MIFYFLHLLILLLIKCPEKGRNYNHHNSIHNRTYPIFESLQAKLKAILA